MLHGESIYPHNANFKRQPLICSSYLTGAASDGSDDDDDDSPSGDSSNLDALFQIELEDTSMPNYLTNGKINIFPLRIIPHHI